MVHSKPKRIVIIVGESSGDLLASGLMESLKKIYKAPLEFYGVGGALMETQGLKPFFPMADINLLGLVEVLQHLPRVFKRLRETERTIRDMKPDIVVTVDAPAFNMRLHKRLFGSGISVVHYVAPTVWAWHASRAKTIAKYVDHLLTIYPFEAPYFEKYGLPVTFVGHGVTQLGIEKADGVQFRHQHNIPEDAPVLCVLPGSRRSELERLTPIFKDVVARVHVDFPLTRFVIPTLPHRRALLHSFVKDWDVPLVVVEDFQEKYQAFKASTVALAASGTVALELACARLPMVICYKVNWLTGVLGRFLSKLKFICMLNILQNKEIVPEFVQKTCTSDRIYSAVLCLLRDETKRQAMIRGTDQSLNMLKSPSAKTPSDLAAQVVQKLIS